MPRAKVVVIRADEGKVTEFKTVEGTLADVAKKVASQALEEWNPETSDFTALHTKLELQYRKPLPPEVADAIFDLNLEYSLEGDNVIVNLPVIVVSFDSQWIDEEKYVERKIYVIAPYIDESSIQQLKEYAEDATKGPKSITALSTEALELSEEQLQVLEEGLEEIEEAEKKRGRRRRSGKRR